MNRSPLLLRFVQLAARLAVAGILTVGDAADAQSLAPKRTLAATAPQGCAALLVPTNSQAGNSAGDDVETRRLISAGQEASLQGEHVVARDAFAQAAKRSPHNAVLAYYLGREHEALDANNDAVREYCRYLQLSPNAQDADEVQGRIVRLTPRSQLAQVSEARANFSSALALLERRQYVAADSMLGSILAKLPNSPEPYFNRGLARAARGERTLAMQDFAKYIDLSGNPADRAAINAAVARLQDRVFSTTSALSSGLAIPGLGQMSTGRPLYGVGVLGAVAAALFWGMIQETELKPVTFIDPFDNPYVDTIRVKKRPNLVIAATAASALWIGSAVEAMSYARRSRARAESIIQIGVPRADDADVYFAVDTRSIGAGLILRLP